MVVKSDALSPQLKALKQTNLSQMIKMAGVMTPRVFKSFVKTLNEKQKAAFDKIMPVGEGKKIFVHLTDTPTPPIVVELAQPMKIATVAEDKVKQQQLKGIKLTVDDLQILANGLKLGSILKFAWRIKGQLFTLVGMMKTFWPLIRLGPGELKDLQNKAMTHFKPLLDLLPRTTL